ncbi:MAG: ATP-binding protein [Lachnospiraceae bacterium]|nr:ATP-binding protein [Lachnospiraceae bacterium]
MKSIELDATLVNLPKVIDFIDQNLEEVGCDMKAQMKIDISVEELFVNIAHYAYHDVVGKAKITFEYLEESRMVRIQLVDCGMHYDPLAKADPDITLSAEEREIGGLGILMVKKNMDDIQYEYVDGQNITSIYKRVE